MEYSKSVLGLCGASDHCIECQKTDVVLEKEELKFLIIDITIYLFILVIKKL